MSKIVKMDAVRSAKVELFPRRSTKGVAGSKATGEPPVVLASCVFSALRGAISAARADQGKDPWVRLDALATPKDIALAIGATPKLR